jgi:acyl carrier protein
MDTTLNRITVILAEQLALDKEVIKPESRIIDDLGADSLDVVEIVMEIEDEFDIRIEDEAAEKVKTVSELVELIDERGGK